MPVLKNQRHEQFAQAYVRGETAGNATATHKAIYGVQAANRVTASKILSLANVSARIADIRDEIANIEAEANENAAEKLGITKEWVLLHLRENVVPPKPRKYEATAANKALELLGKHVGMFTSSDGPTVNVNVGLQFIDRPSAETQEEWEARRRAELAPKPKLINGKANGNGKAHS